MHEKIWLKRVLIPLWIIQLAVLVILVGLSAFALHVSNDDGTSEDFETDNPDMPIHALSTAAAIILAFALFTIVLIMVEIALAAVQRLNPVANLVMQCIKSAIWTVYFVLVVAGAAVDGGTGSGLSVFLALLMFLACIALLVYGSVIVHRYRK